MKLIVAAGAVAILAALAGCGGVGHAAVAKPKPHPHGPTCASMSATISTLAAGQAAQDKALQDDWWEGREHTSDLQSAISQTNSAQSGIFAQFNQDAQTYLNDNTPFPGTSVTSDANALRSDIVAMVQQCGVQASLAPNPPAGGV